MVFADMHTRLGFRDDISIRAAMAQGGMLIVAENSAPRTWAWEPTCTDSPAR